MVRCAHISRHSPNETLLSNYFSIVYAEAKQMTWRRQRSAPQAQPLWFDSLQTILNGVEWAHYPLILDLHRFTGVPTPAVCRGHTQAGGWEFGKVTLTRLSLIGAGLGRCDRGDVIHFDRASCIKVPRFTPR